ncbi:MAG TPA: UDP-N-acetylmuramate:L-alanyl-gamma-D-glutamyl-meso-diaminopimelate ligase, partial [Pseudomonadales bacterium]|nr:UDP-N-acetylmuramate:L-alanyl-gamma-D-glutamyl-meso-diaminopimelate ligase [Pseudomonadales bacterium]
AGTHGKTTTTSMVAWILEYAGLTPGFLIGGIPGNFDSSARVGSAPFFVIEADEYDTSYFDRRSKFLHYRPRTLVLGNLEYDHADIFADLAAIQYQFHLLLRTVPANGLIIHPVGSQNIDEVLAMGCWTPELTFGFEGKADVTAGILQSDGSAFAVAIDGARAGEVHWKLTGNHNVSNALAAIAAARHAGVPARVACEALSRFAGVKRRMEKIFDSPDVTLYDDFAHHPTAIKTTLAGLRERVGTDRVLAIIELGSHTMKKGTHQQTLAAAPSAADNVIWFAPPGLSWPAETALSGNGAIVTGTIDDIVSRATTMADAGFRHIVIMSNSGFGGLRERLRAALGNRNSQIDSSE